MSVQCKPLPCEAQSPPLPCSHPGFVTVTRPRADNPCCPETVCGKTLWSRGAWRRVTGDRAGAHQGPMGWAQESRGEPPCPGVTTAGPLGRDGLQVHYSPPKDEAGDLRPAQEWPGDVESRGEVANQGAWREPRGAVKQSGPQGRARLRLTLGTSGREEE